MNFKNVEELQVVKYEKGGFYKTHYDDSISKKNENEPKIEQVLFHEPKNDHLQDIILENKVNKDEIKRLYEEIFKLKIEVKELKYQNFQYKFLDERKEQIEELIFNYDKINNAVTNQFLKQYEPLLKEFALESEYNTFYSTFT